MGMDRVLLSLEDPRHRTSTAHNEVMSSQGYLMYSKPLTEHMIPPGTMFIWTDYMETRQYSPGNMIFVIFEPYPISGTQAVFDLTERENFNVSGCIITPECPSPKR